MSIYANNSISNTYNPEFKIASALKAISDRWAWVSILVLETIHGVYVSKLGVHLGISKNNTGRHFCHGEQNTKV